MIRAAENVPASTKGEEQNKTALLSPSIAHLRWPPLMGRDDECGVIATSIVRVIQTESPEIVWVSGESGTGKSTAIRMSYDIALSKINKDAKTSDIVWVSGKYDEQLNGARPFSAMMDAFAELYGKLHGTVIRRIHEEFTSDELSHLSAIMPIPASVLNPQGDDCDEVVAPDLDDSMTSKNDANKFRTFVRLFRRMLALICKEYTCVVVVLDDVQWCDDASRELLENMLSDTFCDGLSNFCFMVAQRTGNDATDFTMPETKLSVNKVKLDSLRERKLIELVALAFNVKPSEMRGLAKTIHRRTGGNTHFVVQFVADLCTKQLIKSNGSGQFEWDLQEIATETRCTENVTDILIQKLKDLPFEVQMVLIVAAHVGSQFDCKVLSQMLESTDLYDLFVATNYNASSLRTYLTTLSSGLDLAVKTGLIEQLPIANKYRFAHDRVQKAAQSLLPVGQIGNSILAKIGELLLRQVEAKKGEAWMIFSATNLLTKYYPSGDSRISGKRIALLHHKAAKMARYQTAYAKAASHAEAGAKILGQHAWTKDYQLSLSLHCIAAEMYFAAGNMESSMAMVTKIEERAVCVPHCFRAYNVLTAILGARCDRAASVTECRKRLTLLGVTLPENPGQLNVVKNFMKIKLLLKGRSAKHLEKLPPMKDDKKMQAVRMLGHVGEAYWGLGDDDGCACACLIMMQIVLKYGISSEGVYAFTAYAICLQHLGAIKECATFFELSRKMAENNDIALSIISAALHHLGLYLCNDFASSSDDLIRACEASVRRDDIYRAGFNLRDACSIGMLAGFRLNELQERIDFCVAFFKDYQDRASWEFIVPWIQFADCIRGQTDDTTLLSGKFILEDTVLEHVRNSSNLDTARRVIVLSWHYCQNFLLLLYCEHERVLEAQQKFKHIPEEMGHSWPKIVNCFTCALSHFSLIPSKKSTRGEARKYARVLKKLSVTNSPLITTMLVVIEAEEAALSKKKERAFDLYKEAANKFERQRMYLYKALSLERAARFALAMRDKSIGLHFFKDSCDEYKLFGAEAKVRTMQQQLEMFQAANLFTKESVGRTTSAQKPDASQLCYPNRFNIYYHNVYSE